MTKTKPSRKIRKITVSERAAKCRANKAREIRDLYNKLMKKYNYYKVLDWFELNYFVQEQTLMQMIKRSDNLPVDLPKASINYLTAINPDFHL